jgi:hypothetical protein
MEQKVIKTYLPSSYEQFLQQKKKNIKPVVFQKQFASGHDPVKENKVTSLNRKSSEAENEAEEDEAQTKGGVIVEKVVHSDYKKMFDEFNSNKFDAIKSKINNELKRLQENPPI